jgi:hypothetical protein
MTSLMSTLQEPLLTPLSHFRKQTPSTPLSLSPSLLSTSSPSNRWTPPPPSLVLDLSLPPPQPQTSQLCSGNSGFTPRPLSPPTASVSLTRPTTRLLFRSPLPKGEAVRQALAWNREQLLDLRRLWEQRRQQRINRGLIPMTHPPTMISDPALGVESKENTATATTPIIPNPSLDLPPNPPRVTLSGSVPPDGVARFNLSRAEATALAARLTTSLGQDNQDPTPIPPVRDYREEFTRVVAESLSISHATAAEGLGLRSQRGRRGGQGRGNRSQTLPDNERPYHTQSTQSRQSARRPASPTPPGFEHNRGPAFIPFRIRTDTGGETRRVTSGPISTLPNPFVEGRLSINGPPIIVRFTPRPSSTRRAPPPIPAELLRLLDTDYMGHDNVDEAIGEIGDRSLRAEVNRYRKLERKRKSFQESIRRLEDQMFTTDVERRMCISRLEAARAMVRIQAEMQSNRQAFRLSPWSLERGRLP